VYVQSSGLDLCERNVQGLANLSWYGRDSGRVLGEDLLLLNRKQTFCSMQQARTACWCTFPFHPL